MNLSNIHSELETYKAHIKPGMTVIYSDIAWTGYFTVLEVNKDSITVQDEEGYKETHDFNTLQHGWKLKSSDKELLDLSYPMIEGEGAPQYTMFDLPKDTQLALL